MRFDNLQMYILSIQNKSLKTRRILRKSKDMMQARYTFEIIYKIQFHKFNNR